MRTENNIGYIDYEKRFDTFANFIYISSTSVLTSDVTSNDDAEFPLI